jgi:hypothetical protein
LSLDMLLFLIRVSRSILVNESELWLSSTVAPRLKRRMLRATKQHAKGLALLIQWSSSATCPTPAHQQYYYHAGNQEYRCSMCERLAVWIA